MVQRYGGFIDCEIPLARHFAYQTIGNRLYNVTFMPKVKVREAG